MVERNKKEEMERRKWRKEHERYGKFNITNYNLDGDLEGTLNFIYWKCDCCQDGFQRVRPVLHEKDLFVHEGQNVMVKRGTQDTQARKVPLCNRCITLYYYRGWLDVEREKNRTIKHIRVFIKGDVVFSIDKYGNFNSLSPFASINKHSKGVNYFLYSWQVCIIVGRISSITNRVQLITLF